MLDSVPLLGNVAFARATAAPAASVDRASIRVVRLIQYDGLPGQLSPLGRRRLPRHDDESWINLIGTRFTQMIQNGRPRGRPFPLRYAAVSVERSGPVRPDGAAAPGAGVPLVAAAAADAAHREVHPDHRVRPLVEPAAAPLEAARRAAAERAVARREAAVVADAAPPEAEQEPAVAPREAAAPQAEEEPGAAPPAAPWRAEVAPAVVPLVAVAPRTVAETVAEWPEVVARRVRSCWAAGVYPRSGGPDPTAL